MEKWLLSSLLLLLISCSHSQSDALAESEVDKETDTVLTFLGIDHELATNPRYRFQFVYTPISNGNLGETYTYNTTEYYYPASLVKFMVAAVLLEELNKHDIPLDAYPVFDTVNACGSTKFVELSKNKISFRQMLRELMVVSDNHFYNALYHFITPQKLNQTLKAKGAVHTKIYRPFTGCDVNQSLHTYPCSVFNENGKLIYEVSESKIDTNILNKSYSYSTDRLFGSQHENSDGEIVPGPYDLNYHLEIPLEEIHYLFSKFLFPGETRTDDPWSIRDSDRQFLMKIMGLKTNEIRSAYRSISHLDPYAYKYARTLHGDQETRSLSKLGLSYGFASEIAYIELPGTNEAMLLSYSIYVNENDIVNDGDYEYEELARPFAVDLLSTLIDWQLYQK